MFEILYQKIFLENTLESTKADEMLTEKINEFLKDKKVSDLRKEEMEELIYVAGSIGHKEGFLCAVSFFKAFFTELFMTK